MKTIKSCQSTENGIGKELLYDMTFNEIKEKAKEIVYGLYGHKKNGVYVIAPMDQEEWRQKYFNPFGAGLNEKEATLLNDIAELFVEFKQGKYTPDEVNNCLLVYKSWFEDC